MDETSRMAVGCLWVADNYVNLTWPIQNDIFSTVVNVIKVTTAVTSVLDVIKHFYGRILRQQSHLVA